MQLLQEYTCSQLSVLEFALFICFHQMTREILNFSRTNLRKEKNIFQRVQLLQIQYWN